MTSWRRTWRMHELGMPCWRRPMPLHRHALAGCACQDALCRSSLPACPGCCICNTTCMCTPAALPVAEVVRCNYRRQPRLQDAALCRAGWCSKIGPCICMEGEVPRLDISDVKRHASASAIHRQEPLNSCAWGAIRPQFQLVEVGVEVRAAMSRGFCMWTVRNSNAKSMRTL